MLSCTLPSFSFLDNVTKVDQGLRAEKNINPNLSPKLSTVNTHSGSQAAHLLVFLQPVIWALHFYESTLASRDVPYKEIWNSALPLPVIFAYHLTDDCERMST